MKNKRTYQQINRPLIRRVEKRNLALPLRQFLKFWQWLLSSEMVGKKPLFVRKYSLLLGFLLFSLPLLKAQNQAYLVGKGTAKLVKLETSARSAFDNQDYYSAFKLYQDALKLDQQKIENRYQMARAAEQYGAFCAARVAYETVVRQDTANLFESAKVKLAEMEIYRGNYNRADSILFEMETNNPSLDVVPFSIQNIDFVDSIRERDRMREAALPVNVGPTINTPFAEVNPIWRNGKLYYGSLAYPKKKDSVKPRREYARTLTNNMMGASEDWQAFNRQDLTRTHLSFTPSDNRMYFSQCDYIDNSFNLVCEIYYKDKIGGSPNDWGPAQKLPEFVNSPGLSSTQPAVGRNEKGEEVLFFVSDRPSPEAMGGMDIWYTKINGDNTFGTPVNLGASINTAKDDITPFYHFPSQTLYFSSNGRAGFGGHDIFKTRVRTGENWENPSNLSEPLNSSANDFDYFLTEANDQAFLVSNREGCDDNGDIETGCFDIYRVDNPPSNTEIIAYLFAKETGAPLTEGQMFLQASDEPLGPNQVEGNKFTFDENIPIVAYNLTGNQAGYLTQTEPVTIVEGISNIFKIYLPCQPNLSVSVFAKRPSDAGMMVDLPLPDATVELVAAEAETISAAQQNGHQYEYLATRNQNYRLTVTHPLYNNSTLDFTVNECETQKLIYLVPSPVRKPEYDTIAAYFHHDIPKRKVRGKPDPSTDLAYNEFYFDYKNLNSYYQTRFSRGERGTNIEKNRQAVRDFFKNEVDSSYIILEKFKDDLLLKLATLPEGEVYIINIKGYASNIGDTDYNLELAQRRINSVKNYFTKTHGDKFNTYLFEKRNLIFEELPVGEVGSGFDTQGDYKNTIYNPESAIKRRVEIIQVPVKEKIEENATRR